jgi:phosphatidate cytidylyltransferase
MKQRIITGLIFTLVIAAFVLPGFRWPLLPVALFVLVALVGSLELRQALDARKIHLLRLLTLPTSLLFLLPLLVTGLEPTTPAVDSFMPLLAKSLTILGFTILALCPLLPVIELIRNGPEALPVGIAGSSLMVYLAFPLGCGLILLMTIPQGWLWLIIALMAPWFSDMFAYFTGSAIGRNPIVPKVSPKKTVEGCIGGVAGSMLSLALFFYFVLRHRSGMPSGAGYNLLFALGSGLILSVASQLGDWLASGIKRWCGIKDFGSILPGHGGVLDRFDSVLFTLPVTLFLAIFYPLLAR